MEGYYEERAKAAANRADKRLLEYELSLKEPCPICQEVLSSPNSNGGNTGVISVFPCGHRFHRGCINMWIQKNSKNTCPICRGPFNKKQYGGRRKTRKTRKSKKPYKAASRLYE
jgi:hypothetical protein